MYSQGLGGALQGRDCEHPQQQTSVCYREGNLKTCLRSHAEYRQTQVLLKLMKGGGGPGAAQHRNEMLQRVYGTAWADKDEIYSSI